MDIGINEVKDMIESLESNGELSIKEEKYLKVAKLCVKLDAENVAIREQSEEVYAAGYNHGHLNTVDGIAYAGCVKDDFYSLALQVMAEIETPATDRIVAWIKADGVEELVSSRGGSWNGTTEEALKFAKQLREGKSEEVKS